MNLPIKPDNATTENYLFARILFFAAPAFWVVNYLVARWGPGEAAPHVLAMGRWTIALLLMLLLFSSPLRREWPVLREEWRLHWKQFVFLGALGMCICGAWVYQGGRTTTSFNIALIYSLAPMLIAWVSTRLLHERMDWFQRIGLIISVVGVFLVICKGDLTALLRFELVPGDIWILAAAVSWTAYSVLLKYWHSPLSPQVRLMAITAGGLLVLFPLTVAEFVLWNADAWLTPKGLGLMVLAGVFPGILAYQSHSYILQKLGAARTSSMIHLSTIYAALAGWLILGESLYWYHFAGAALVLPGVFLASRPTSIKAKA